MKLPGGLQGHHPIASAIIVHADGLPRPQRNQAILTIAIGLVMAVMDGAIANVALPTIAKDLNASPAFSIWIVNGYQLAITISLLPLASLGEIIGYRRVYLAGLLLFTLASLFCVPAHTLLLLTVACILQGFGAAAISSRDIVEPPPRSQIRCLPALTSGFPKTGWWAHQGSNLGPDD